jgi:tetratricopeptide (TPR) repeat protein
MADTGEQGTTGHAPAEPGSVKIDMGQGPPPVRRPAPRPATRGIGASIAISSLLALLCGGAGAWAYERFLAPARPEKTPEAAARQGGDAGSQKDLARADDRLNKLSEQYNGLSEQYKQLQSRLESIPRPAPAPDLAPLEQKVSQVDRLSQQVEAIGKKLDPLPQQLTQSERRLTELESRLDEPRRSASVARARTPAAPDRDDSVGRTDRPSPSPADSSNEADRPSPSPGERAGSAPASSEKRGSADLSLEAGESRFREGRYQEAYDVFRRLLQAQPNDARVWYYGALSYGLATQDWGRATETMIQEGVNREKAGQPPKPEIDAAFAGLTKETGKDWLDYYRRRAQ